jgi:undecaprenyl-diphosphatase
MRLLAGATAGCIAFFLLAVLSRNSGEFSLLHAIVLGIIEGISEYLPVSSTGHLLVAQNLMGLTKTDAAKSAADAYAIIIQIGAILAVTGLYRNRVKQMIMGLFGRDQSGLNLIFRLIIAFIPAALMGLLFSNMIKQVLFGLLPISIAWFIGGLIIIIFAAGPPAKHSNMSVSIDSMSMKQALIIGLFQILALWPGVSRSLATILGGLVAGLTLPFAVEFSFLLGLITLCAATCYEMLKSGGEVIFSYGWFLPAIGIFSSFISAWIAVKWLLNYLTQHGLALFGYYRIILAITTGLLIYLEIAG